MAGIREFFTKFNIGAVFTGAAAFAQAQAAVKKTEHAGVLASISLRKLAGSVAAFALGYKGLTGATDFIKESIESAREGKDAYDKLSLSMQRAAIAHKLGADTAKQQTENLAALAKQMQEAGGISAKTLEAGFSGLLASFSPKQIYDMSAGFQDLMVKMKGVKPSADEVAAVTKQVGLAIKNGAAPMLVRMRILTAAQAKELKKMHDEGQRAAFMYDILAKKTGETARAMDTSKGIQERYRLAWESIKDAIGEPFIKTQDAFAKSSTKILEAIRPIAEELAAKVTPAFEHFANNLGSYTPQIVGFVDKVAQAFTWILDHWQEIVNALTSIAAAFLIFKTFEGVVSIITTLSTAFKGLMAVFSSGPAIMAAMTNPVTLVIVGLAALAAAIYLVITHWDDVKKAAESAWNWIVGAWGNAANWFQSNVWGPLKESTRGVWEPLVEPLRKLWEEIGPIVQGVTQEVVKAFADIPRELGDIWQKVVNTAQYLGRIVQIIAPFAQQAFQNWLTAVQWVSSNIIAPIISFFADLIAKIKVGDLWGAFQAWVNVVQTIETNIVNAIVALFAGLPGQIGAAIGGVTAAITAPFRAAYDQIVSWFSNIGQTIQNALNIKQPALPAATTPPPSMAPGLGAVQKQSGGLVAHPSIAALAERGIPEMVIPMQGTSRSRGLLSQTANAIGLGGLGGRGGGAAGSISVSLNAPITINGAGAGQEGAIGREVQRAMQDPIRNLLEQLKRARNEEARLAYA